MTFTFSCNVIFLSPDIRPISWQYSLIISQGYIVKTRNVVEITRSHSHAYTVYNWRTQCKTTVEDHWFCIQFPVVNTIANDIELSTYVWTWKIHIKSLLASVYFKSFSMTQNSSKTVLLCFSSDTFHSPDYNVSRHHVFQLCSLSLAMQYSFSHKSYQSVLIRQFSWLVS